MGALEKIYAIHLNVDFLLCNGRYGEVDDLLVERPVSDTDTDSIISLLTATLPAKSKLLHRKEYFASAQIVLGGRGEDVAGCLGGLE